MIQLENEPDALEFEKAVYAARKHTAGGRDSASSSDDAARANPDELFAAGWSACFESAMGVVARELKIALPAGLSVDAEVELCLGDSGYFLQAKLHVCLPGLEPQIAHALMYAAHRTRPFSKSIGNNMDVVVTLV